MRRSQIPEDKKETHKIRLKLARIVKYTRAEEDIPGTKGVGTRNETLLADARPKIKLRLEPNQGRQPQLELNLGDKVEATCMMRTQVDFKFTLGGAERRRLRLPLVEICSNLQVG